MGSPVSLRAKRLKPQQPEDQPQQAELEPHRRCTCTCTCTCRWQALALRPHLNWLLSALKPVK